MTSAILKLCILILQFLYISCDSHTHHHHRPQNQNVVRVSLGTNFSPNNRLQFLRQAVPITQPIERPTLSETVLESNSLSCSQTVNVAQVTDQVYHFVVPQNNSANLYCVITIYGQKGKQLLLQLTEVNLPPGVFECEFDAVQVYSLNDGNLSFKEKFCNLSQPSAEILTDNNVAVITFNAGNQPYEQGFRIEVRPIVLIPDHGGQTEEGSHEELNSGYEHGGYHYPYYPSYQNTTHSYIPPDAYQPYEYYNVTQTGYGPPPSPHYGPPKEYGPSIGLPSGPNGLPPKPHYGPPLPSNNPHPRPEYGPPKPDNPFPPTSQYGPPPNTGYGPPSNGYKPPSNGYGPPSTGYPNPSNPYHNDCNDQPWAIIEKPGDNYETNQPTRTRFNQDFYSWLTSATTGNKWSKEIPPVKRSLLI